MTPTVLILPGPFNSGEGHWQTLWKRMLPNAVRVRQQDWNALHRNEPHVAKVSGALLVASADVERADFHAIGPCGHINAASVLGAWSQGRKWLEEFLPDQ